MTLRSETRKTKLGAFVFLTVVSILWIAPLLWIISTSLKPESQAISWPLRWIPETLTFENYINVLSSTDESPILLWFWNSLFIATVHTALVLVVDALAAFAYARLQFRGKEVLFWALMATMMVPTVMNLVPLYSIVESIGWVDTPWAMIVPGLGGVFGIFLLRQFFETIPKDLEEAARIDGASTFQVFTRVVLPLSKPALVTLALFTFLANWNDYLWPLIVTNDVETRTLPVGLSMLQGAYTTQYAKLMAGTVLSAVPVLIMFLFTQRFFVKGLSAGGVKG